MVSNIVNVVGSSCKRRDIVRKTQAATVARALENGEIESRRGLNQETALKRAGDTRWGSHYESILNLTDMYSTVCDVLETIQDEGPPDKRADARALLSYLYSFEFALSLYLMRRVLGITNELSLLLQKKDQDIVNAMRQVKVCKIRLQKMREEGWESLLADVSVFCGVHGIRIPSMEEIFVPEGRPRRNTQQITNGQRFQNDLFNKVVEMQLEELNNQFTEVVNSSLLTCIACLSPDNSFASFNKDSLQELAKLYPSQFSNLEISLLDNQLENYIVDIQSEEEFAQLKGIGDLARTLVETKRHIVYPLVYLLIKLALILPVATATVERVFSTMKYIKNRLRNRMSDEWLNDCLITYIEKDMFDTVSNDSIMNDFQKGKRRGNL